MTPRARLALATIALLALLAFVYAPVLRGVFIWDDHALIETNDLVEHGSVREIFRMPYRTPSPSTDAPATYYRPITMLSFRADFAFAGTEAGSFHATNLFMHLCATLMLVLAARRFGASPAAAVMAAAVWALHPRTTECVAWIAGRTDVIAVGFGLAALGLWPWYAQPEAEADPDPSADASARRRQWARASAAAIAILLALLAKEVAIVFVVAIAVATLAGSRSRRSLRRAALLAAPLAIYLALRWMALRNEMAKLPPLGGWARVGTMLEAVGRYVDMALDAWHPASSIGLVGELDRGRAALGGLVLLVCAAVTVRAIVRSRRRSGSGSALDGPRLALVVAGLLVIGPLALSVPLTLSSGVTADRLLYLPLAGLVLGAAVAAAKLSSRNRRIAGAVAVTLAATFIPVTRARARDYTSELQFRVVAAEQAHPHNTALKTGLANMLRPAAELGLVCRLHASVRRTLERGTAERTARYVRALENLGSCYAAAGDYEAAAAVYSDLVALQRDSGRIQMEIGFLELHTFALDRAEVSLSRAIELEPTLALARRTLHMLPALRTALALSTEDARVRDPRAWAELLTALGRVPDATKAWLVIALDPASDDGVALEAAEFVIENADAATARQAGDALLARPHFAYAPRLQRRLAARLTRQARVDALRPRIEALGAQ